ncbi:BrnT family toxin [Erysipelotrichaceae bacterium Oil+RF-744-GAM-WT-6]|uniref:BrnT family toxin n=1 Tax=Stecheria intestinalis TaxID=2606630 RepID=A0A7X2NU52_9FIRM|nr:BrnT family toxin [Stecheria intestinalis]
MTHEQTLSFHDDKLIVHWDSEKDSINYHSHHIHLYFAAYTFFDENLAEIYDEGNSSVDPSNLDNTEHRLAIIGYIRDVPFYVAYIVEDDGSEGNIPAVRIYSARFATKNELNICKNRIRRHKR